MAYITIEEWMKQNGPRYEQMAAEVERGLAGLAKYAALLAVQGQREQLPRLREMVEFMAGYWLSPTLKTEHDHARDMVNAFDAAVASAQASGYAEDLSGEDMAAIITGLQTHIQELRTDEDQLDLVPDYKDLCDRLRQAWYPLRLSVELPPPTAIPPKGMTAADWLEANRPRHEAMQNIIRKCLSALAPFAAEGPEEQFPRLRWQVDLMATFWFGSDETVRDDLLRQFDQSIAAAGQSAALSEEDKTAVLDGLKLTIWEMHQDLDDDSVCAEYEELLSHVEREWAPELQAPQMGGIGL